MGIKNLKKLMAFSLAEVLITIGIIGVVAAMVLPPLMKDYENAVFANSLRKANSVLNNLTKNAMARDGVGRFVNTDLGEAWDGGDTSSFETVLRQHFVGAVEFYKGKSINKLYCEKTGNKVNRCPYDYNNLYAIGTLFSPLYNDGYGNCALASGILYCFDLGNRISPRNSNMDFNTTTPLMSDYGFAREIFVDVNGFKKPNIPGRDVFFFAIGSKTGNVVPDGSYAVVEDYYVNGTCGSVPVNQGKDACISAMKSQAKSNYESLKNNQYYYCNGGTKNSSGYYSGNTYCADKVMSAGWKMDY